MTIYTSPFSFVTVERALLFTYYDIAKGWCHYIRNYNIIMYTCLLLIKFYCMLVISFVQIYLTCHTCITVNNTMVHTMTYSYSCNCTIACSYTENYIVPMISVISVAVH